MFAKRNKQLHIRGKDINSALEEKLSDDKITSNLSKTLSHTQSNSKEFDSNLKEFDSNLKVPSDDNSKKHIEISESSDNSDSCEQRLKSVKRNLSKTTCKFIKQKKLKTKNFELSYQKNNLFSYPGQRSLDFDNDLRATSQFSIDTEKNYDNRSILERNEEIGNKILSGELDENVYRGIGAYKPILKRREGAIAAGKYTGAYGPVRGSDNIRMTMRIDLNPEICKDYKETGYCGFGDTCKFLHDRSDYKAGWQLEKEWEEAQRKKQEHLKRLAEGLYEDNEDESKSISSSDDESHIPFACLICKQRWEASMNPVVTTCGHYFCENCAFKQYSKSSKCAYCKTETSGIFGNADYTIQSIQKKEKNNG